MERKCDNCQKEYVADMRNVKRGWGLCCSKSCAASKREKSKPGYDPVRVEKNNDIRVMRSASFGFEDKNHYGTYRGRRTSEGYKIYGTTAVDEFDNPVYEVSGYDDPGDDDYWATKDFD